MISVRKLVKKYQQSDKKEKIVLKGLNVEFERGEKVVIVGPSGSGKSTFLRCLNLLEIPDSGEIWLDNRRISEICTDLYPKLVNLRGKQLQLAIQEYDKKDRQDINEARAKMGMVFQHFNLFNNLNVIENITLAPIKLKKMTANEAKETALALLARVGLYDKAYEYPSRLSGGQKHQIMATLNLKILPNRRKLSGKLGIYVSLTFKKEVRYISTEFEVDDEYQFENGKVCYRKDAAIMNKRIQYVLGIYRERMEGLNLNRFSNCAQI